MQLNLDAKVKGFGVKPDKEEDTPTVTLTLEIDDMAHIDIGRLACFLGQHVTVVLSSPQARFDVGKDDDGQLALLPEKGARA